MSDPASCIRRPAGLDPKGPLAARRVPRPLLSLPLEEAPVLASRPNVELHAGGNVADVALVDMGGDGRRGRATGDPMMRFEQCTMTLTLAVLLASGFSCADDDEPEQGPTQEEMQQVASDVCEQGIGCGTIDAITLEECIEYEVGVYQVSPECVAVYYLDECLTTQTCEEIERLNQLNIGECADERDETSRVHALCVP